MLIVVQDFAHFELVLHRPVLNETINQLLSASAILKEDRNRTNMFPDRLE
jgi:hypothetical protein